MSVAVEHFIGFGFIKENAMSWESDQKVVHISSLASACKLFLLLFALLLICRGTNAMIVGKAKILIQ